MNLTTSTIKNVRDRHITAAVEALNKARGLSYPDIGHMRYADIKGDGSNRRSVYTVTNVFGGVTFSSLNGKTKRATLERINLCIAGVPYIKARK